MMNWPTADEVSAMFKSRPDFGKTIQLYTDEQLAEAERNAWNAAIDACACRMDDGWSYNAGNSCRALRR